MKGTIRLIGLDKVEEGMQVIWNDTIVCKTINESSGWRIQTLGKEFIHNIDSGELKQLVVEYRGTERLDLGIDKEGNKIEGTFIIEQLPILQSQWQEILDRNLINTEVEFETFNIPGVGTYVGDIELDPKSHPEAKVILPKKKVKILEEDTGDYSVLDEIMKEETWDDIKVRFDRYIRVIDSKMNWLDFMKMEYKVPKKK